MIYATSDLHFGISRRGDRAIRNLSVALSSAREDDVLIIAGDIAIDDQGVTTCLDLFRDFPGQKLAVAGNHDVWVEDGDDSWDRFQRLMDIFRTSGFHPLDAAPLIVNGIGFAGTMGWYDGSFREELGIADRWYQLKRSPKGPMWGDALHVRWGFHDAEVTERLADQLEEHLRQLAHLTTVIAITHHLPTDRLLFRPRWLVPTTWRFLNTFLGSERFGQILQRHVNVRQVICGHIHRARHERIGTQSYHSIGSTYDKKQLLCIDGSSVTRRSFAA